MKTTKKLIHNSILNKYSNYYYFILLNLKITFSYFIICWGSVILAIALDLDDGITRKMMLIESLEVFLSYILYPIFYGCILILLINKFIKRSKNRKRIFILLSSLFHFLIIRSFAFVKGLEINDRIGNHHLSLFIFIMFFLIIISHVIWVFLDNRSFDNDYLDKDDTPNDKKYVVKFFIIYYVSLIISLIIGFVSIGDIFDGFIIDPMWMSFNGFLSLIILGFGLFLFIIRQMKLRWLMIVLIPVFLLSYDFYINHPGYDANSKFRRFNELVIHYNPIWLKKENHGHTERNY